MAQLPPKIPTIPPNYHHKGLSWVDEFLDFTAARRGAHRRSVSDSIAFLEQPETSDFDRLDDEQLLSMFSEQVAQPPPVSSDNASVASDGNSVNAEKGDGGERKMKSELEEEHSQCMDGRPAEGAAAVDQAPPAAAAVAETELIVDSKRVKRILANRQSAQRSRVRKLQYISELERSVTTLQTEVSALSPRVAFFDHQRSILTVGNSHLKQRIAALAQDKIFKDAHQEALKKEIERLRQVYQRQKLKNMAASTLENENNK
ncbi:basic leucine zipper 6-like [Dendrobium catenatum]|uniref:Putative transcription factor PosF21 n=1 Tax=Dendrobium catenatum TaxID=906689 RepID=A0A2I0WAJ1_9ASPA|nr:basic leucine zipper 6-like [Dendrobium catenatum]PKU72673.1 putative transcription factor PosF21 [Dendrobium catenatum]